MLKAYRQSLLIGPRGGALGAGWGVGGKLLRPMGPGVEITRL